MIFAFLSARIRSYVMFALVLPVVGRILQTVGVRVGARNPRAGDALQKAGGYARRPISRQQRRGLRRLR